MSIADEAAQAEAESAKQRPFAVATKSPTAPTIHSMTHVHAITGGITVPEYVPTTEEMREYFAMGPYQPWAKAPMSDDARAAMFDRWLAEHDAEAVASIVAKVRHAAHDNQAAREAWASWNGQSEPETDWESFRAGWRAGARCCGVEHHEGAGPVNITDEDREALLRVLVIERKHRISDDGRGGYRCRECGAEFDWTSDEQVRAKRHEHNPVVDAILASDVFARIVQEQTVLNNPQIMAEVSAYHADPSDVEGEIMPIEYRVLVESEVVFTSGHQAIAEGYARGLKLRGEKGRLEVVAVGNSS